MTKRYDANFGTVTNLRITQSRGVPMAAFTLDGGEKFSRDVVVFGAERVEAMKAIGNGRKAWVRGEVTEITKKNENGGTYKVQGLKGYNIKDITDAPKGAAKSEDAAEGADAETGAADAGVDAQADANVDAGVDAGADAGEPEMAGAEGDADADALKGEVPF